MTRFTSGDQFGESRTPLHDLLNKIFAGYTAVTDLQGDLQRSPFETKARRVFARRELNAVDGEAEDTEDLTTGPEMDVRAADQLAEQVSGAEG